MNIDKIHVAQLIIDRIPQVDIALTGFTVQYMHGSYLGYKDTA
jgi:hypothetical protein